MAQEQIQKLTAALYEEGVEKGEKKAADIIREAQDQATKLLADARADAEKILKEAEEQAKTFKLHVETETRIAAREIIHDFHQTVVDMILAHVIDEKMSADLSDAKTLSHWVGKIIENWRCDAKEQPSLTILLSEKDLQEFNKWFEKEISKALQNKVVVQSSEAVKGGFQIVPKDGSYKIDMNVESFQGLFRHYLKARTRKLLFGDAI
jgi:V/A-type H+-transporting ATPase subunit E